MNIRVIVRRMLVTAAICLCTASSALSVMAASGSPYDRRAMVAESEWLLGSSSAEVNKNAWRKINGVCYDGSGRVIEGAFLRGIDVSEWNGTINWNKVKKSDVDFAFVRISDGTWHMDETYDYNMSHANAAGLPVGTYLFSRATTREAAVREAQFAIEKMKGYQVSYPVVYDMEASSIEQLSSHEISQLAVTFCEEVKKAGYFPMVYTNVNWYLNKIDWSQLGDYDVWLAQYTDRFSAPSHDEFRYTIWQSTDGDGGGLLNPTKGLIDGIPAENNVDLNFGFKDYTKVISPRKAPAASYVPTDPESLRDGWVTVDGEEYYYDNGKKRRGWQEISGVTYYFDNTTGALCKNKLIKEGKTIRYVGSDGVPYEDKWLAYKGKTYYFDGTGTAVKGWKKIDGSYYRFHQSTGVMLTNRMFRDSKGVIRYVGSDGKRYEKQWLEYEGQTYRFNVNGEAMKGGWKRIGGKYYYFDETDGYLWRNRRIIKNGNIFYAGEDGVRFNGGFLTVDIDGQKGTYYFGKNGKACRGWHVIKGKKYYFYKGTAKRSGTRAENVTLISSSNVVSVFDENGVCIKQYKNN